MTNKKRNKDNLMTIKEYASQLRISVHAIYRNPAKYYMFRVGRAWRANHSSLKKFEQSQFKNNNVYRLAVVGGMEDQKCRSTKEGKHTGLTYPRQVEKELDALLERKTK